MTNYTHLNKEQRSTIEYLINLNKSFTFIGNSIQVDRTTIAKEKLMIFLSLLLEKLPSDIKYPITIPHIT